jgi:hypothetical protein
MAIRIYTTTIWSKILIIPKFVLWIAVLMSVVSFSDWISSFLTLPIFLAIIIWIVIFIALLIFQISVLSPIFNTLSALLYIRINLKTKISWRQTKQIEWLFVPNETDKWWPMENIKDLPEDLRLPFLFKSAKKISSEIVR